MFFISSDCLQNSHIKTLEVTQPEGATMGSASSAPEAPGCYCASATGRAVVRFFRPGRCFSKSADLEGLEPRNRGPRGVAEYASFPFGAGMFAFSFLFDFFAFGSFFLAHGHDSLLGSVTIISRLLL